MKRLVALLGACLGCLAIGAPGALASSDYAASVLTTPNLLALWRFGEQGTVYDAASGMTAADATGNYPGVYEGGANLGVQGPLEGDPTTAMHIGAPDGAITIPYTAALNPESFTVEVWASFDAGQAYTFVAANGAQYQTTSGFIIETFPDGSSNYAIAMVIGTGSTNLLLKGPDYVPGRWYYIVGTYDGSTARLYVNGQLASSVATPYSPNTSYPLAVGYSPVLGGNNGQLAGSVGDLALYNSALSAATIEQHYQLGINDDLPPDAALDSAPSGTTNATSASLTFSSTSVDPTYQCELDGSGWQPCSSPYQVSGLSNGTHQFSVRAINRAGLIDPNPATATWTIDTEPPVTSFGAGPPSVTNGTQATFVFSSVAGAVFTCQLDNNPPVPCSSPYTVASLTDGAHTFTIQATDRAGNVEPNPSVYAWSVDTAAPSAYIVAGPTSKDPTRPFTFTANKANVTFRCRVDGGKSQPCGSPFTGFSTSPGVHTLQVAATDALGNAGPSGTTYVWSVPGTAVQLHVTFPGRLQSEETLERAEGHIAATCARNVACAANRWDRIAPRLSWRVSETGTLRIAITNAVGRAVAHTSVRLRTRMGSVALPREVLKRLKPGSYVVMLYVTASHQRSRTVTVKSTVAR